MVFLTRNVLSENYLVEAIRLIKIEGEPILQLETKVTAYKDKKCERLGTTPGEKETKNA